jgi:rhomboid protease GluP
MKINPVRTFSFLYLPFLWISIVSAAIYSALNYFLLQYMPLRESVTNIFLPMAFVAVAYVIFYKEKLKTAPKLDNDLMRSFLLVFFFAVPAPVILQSAIESFSIRRHADSTYEDIEQRLGVHQYQLSRPLIFDAKIVGLYPRYYTSYNKNAPDDSHHEAFIVTLVLSQNTQKPLFWFGRKYEHVVRKDRSSDEEKETVYQENIKDAIAKFSRSAGSESVAALEWNRQDDDYQYFQEAIAKIPNNMNSELPVVTDIHSRKRGSETARIAFFVFAGGQLIWAIVCLFIRIDDSLIDDHAQLSVAQKLVMRGRELLDSLSWFWPRKGYMATPIILDLNILVYLLLGFLGVSLMSPSGSDLIPYGSNYSPLVLEGQVWRLFTSAFLHFGFIHLVMNMVALVFSGQMLEQVLGTMRFIVLYCLSALGCSLTSLYWHHPGNAAGASGAIFGIMGAMLFYAVFKIGDKSNRVIFFLVFGIFGLFTLITDLVAWSHSDMAGHLGGMVTGMIVAIFFIPVARAAGVVVVE